MAGVAVECRGWVAIHPVYNIQHDRGLRDVSAHHRSGRGGGKVERRVAIPRAVSCSHVQPRASFCRVFSTYFREPGDFDEWNGGMYRRGRGKKICRDEKKENMLIPAYEGDRAVRERTESRALAGRVLGVKGSRAAKGRTGWGIIGRSVRSV